jgi:hypothetical protein
MELSAGTTCTVVLDDGTGHDHHNWLGFAD